jgi:ketosteroid isomerase-like protein
MMALYEGTLRVEVLALLADEQHGAVRVAESADRPGDGVSYSGVHLWQFREGKVVRFESLYDESYTDFWSRHASVGEHACV